MPSSILVFGSLFLIIVGSGDYQTPSTDAAPLSPHPAILDPIVMSKATSAIDSLLGLEVGGESDLTRFLSLDYWPCFLGNNSTLINLTA